MKPLFSFLFLIFLMILSSCDYKGVKADAKKYCECKNRQYVSKVERGECSKLLGSLKEKYEYLPEQYEILANEIAECSAE
jgi:hypothetical protein